MEKYDIMIDKEVFELNYNGVKETLDGIEEIIKEVPELGEHLDYIGVYSEEAMSCNGREINFNPEWYSNIEKLKKMVKYQSEIGNWVIDSDIKSTGIHEATHGIEWVLSQINSKYKTGEAKYSAWVQGLDAKYIVESSLEALDIMTDGKREKEILKISKIANASYSETMAEAFVDVYLHGNGANKLSLKIKEITMKTLEKYREM